MHSGSDCTYPDFVTCQFLLRTIEIELQLTEVQAVRFRVLDKSSRFTNDGHGSQWARVRLNAQCKGDRLF
jgi:ABC-type cobalamin transport system ATPase subunit